MPGGADGRGVRGGRRRLARHGTRRGAGPRRVGDDRGRARGAAGRARRTPRPRAGRSGLGGAIRSAGRASRSTAHSGSRAAARSSRARSAAGRSRVGATLRLVPGDATCASARSRSTARRSSEVAGGGRTALNLAGRSRSRPAPRHRPRRVDPAASHSVRPVGSSRSPPRSRIGRASGSTSERPAADAVVGRSGRDAARPPGGSAVPRSSGSSARWPRRPATGSSSGGRHRSGPAVVGGVILDPLPAAGVSRRRQTPERVAALAAAVQAGDLAAVHAHGRARTASSRASGVAPDVRVAASAAALDAVRAHHAAQPGRRRPDRCRPSGAAAARALRRQATVDRGRCAARPPSSSTTWSSRWPARPGWRPRPRARPRSRPPPDPEVAGGDGPPLEAHSTVPRRRRCARPRAPPAARPTAIRALERDRPDRPPRRRPRLRRADVPRPGREGARARAGREPAHARRVPRRDRDQPQVRAWRSSRTSIDAGSSAGRRPATCRVRGRRQASRRTVTAATLPAVSGIVLAGGGRAASAPTSWPSRSTGVPLLDHAVDAVAAVATDVIVVAARRTSTSRLPRRRAGSATIDRSPFGGPLAGCWPASIAAREPVVLVVGGDMPTLSTGRPGAARPRADRVRSADAAVLEHRGRRQAAPGRAAQRGRDADARAASPRATASGASARSSTRPAVARRSRRTSGARSTRTARPCATSTARRICRTPSDRPDRRTRPPEGSGGRVSWEEGAGSWGGISSGMGSRVRAWAGPWGLVGAERGSRSDRTLERRRDLLADAPASRRLASFEPLSAAARAARDVVHDDRSLRGGSRRSLLSAPPSVR